MNVGSGEAFPDELHVVLSKLETSEEGVPLGGDLVACPCVVTELAEVGGNLVDVALGCRDRVVCEGDFGSKGHHNGKTPVCFVE